MSDCQVRTRTFYCTIAHSCIALTCTWTCTCTAVFKSCCWAQFCVDRLFTSSFTTIQTPFPVSQMLLCYRVSALAGQGIAQRSISTSFAAGQVLAGFHEPKEYSVMPQLRLVLAGVKCSYAEKHVTEGSSRTCLPIAPPILRHLRRCMSYRRGWVLITRVMA